jgi:microcystin-dependent protein
MPQLNVQQIPLHTHSVRAVKAAGTEATPGGCAWVGSTTNHRQYATGTMDVVMAPDVMGPGGSDQPQNNLPPVTPE